MALGFKRFFRRAHSTAVYYSFQDVDRETTMTSRPMTSRPRGAAGLLLWAALGGCSENNLIAFDGDDVFYQLEAGQVDVLLAIDNSCSMSPYQTKLSQNFNQFLTFFLEGDVDYQIGVVTSSVAPTEPFEANGCFQDDVDAIPEAGHLVGGNWITAGTPDAAAIFEDRVQVGICGSGYEMGIESAFRAVSPPLSDTVNAGFLRPEAYLSIIFVSDEQDASPRTVNEYINAFNQVKGQRNREIFNASALVVTNPDNCGPGSGSSSGSRYLDVARQTDGVIGDICADDFGSIVTELSLASSRLEDTFYLSDAPDAASLIVGIGEEEVPCDSGRYAYRLLEENGQYRPAIVFDRAQLPPPNSRITASYDLGDGDPERFCTATEEE